METDWIYYGAFLDGPARENLLEYVKQYVPIENDWKLYCDHMTIIYNDGSDNAAMWADSLKDKIYQKVYLTVVAVGVSEKSIAVKVAGFKSNNAIPHVTIAVAPGAKPVDSNNIINWWTVDDDFGFSASINVVLKNRK